MFGSAMFAFFFWIMKDFSVRKSIPLIVRACPNCSCLCFERLTEPIGKISELKEIGYYVP